LTILNLFQFFLKVAMALKHHVSQNATIHCGCWEDVLETENFVPAPTRFKETFLCHLIYCKPTLMLLSNNSMFYYLFLINIWQYLRYLLLILNLTFTNSLIKRYDFFREALQYSDSVRGLANSGEGIDNGDGFDSGRGAAQINCYGMSKYELWIMW